MTELLVESEHSELLQHEQVIEHGLRTFVDVGNALLAIRDKRLYRQDFGTFEEYCGERWGFSSTHAKRLVDSAIIAQNLEPFGAKYFSESHLRPLKNLQPEQQREVYQKAVETAPNGKVTAAHVEATVRGVLPPNASRLTLQPPSANTFSPRSFGDVVRSETRFAPAPLIRDDEFDDMADDGDGYDWTEDDNNDEQAMTPITAPTSKPHVAHNSGNNEWYTPEEYITAARQVLGRIDLDPATSEIANKVVRADEFYTAQDDGLAQHWTGKVWMNPPYSSDLVGRFAEKLCVHYEDNDVTEAIVLVNNATETGWFQRMAQTASCVCFPRARVKFWKPDGETGAPLQGQAILYFGTKKINFIAAFRSFGFVGVINGVQ